MVGYSSGQRGQTVNLLAYAFQGSNPCPTTIFRKALQSIWLLGLLLSAASGYDGSAKAGLSAGARLRVVPCRCLSYPVGCSKGVNDTFRKRLLSGVFTGQLLGDRRKQAFQVGLRHPVERDCLIFRRW